MNEDEQNAHFDAFGFLPVRELLTPDEVDAVTRGLDAALLEARGGRPFDGKERQVVTDWFRGRVETEFLVTDRRIHGPVERLLGPGSRLQESNDGNYYVGDTDWHPDMGWDPHIPDGREDPARTDGPMRNHYVPSIKVGFYLDEVGRDTGCLRVVPGSHRSPFHERFWSLHSNIASTASEDAGLRARLPAMWERETGRPEDGERFLADPSVNQFGLEPRDIPAYAIESRPGDAVFFSHQIWHSSFGGHAGRRMFTLNFRGAQG